MNHRRRRLLRAGRVWQRLYVGLLWAARGPIECVHGRTMKWRPHRRKTQYYSQYNSSSAVHVYATPDYCQMEGALGKGCVRWIVVVWGLGHRDRVHG